MKIIGFEKYNECLKSVQEFIKTSDIYIIEDDGLITDDGMYVNQNDVHEQMED